MMSNDLLVEEVQVRVGRESRGLLSMQVRVRLALRDSDLGAVEVTEACQTTDDYFKFSDLEQARDTALGKARAEMQTRLQRRVREAEAARAALALLLPETLEVP